MNKIGKADICFLEEMDFDTGPNKGGYCSRVEDSNLRMIKI